MNRINESNAGDFKTRLKSRRGLRGCGGRRGLSCRPITSCSFLIESTNRINESNQCIESLGTSF